MCKSSSAAARLPTTRSRRRASKPTISNASSAGFRSSRKVNQSPEVDAHMRPGIIATFACILVSASARAGDIDPYLPDDTEAVVSVNVRQILDAPLVKKEALDALNKMLEERGGALK